MEISIKDILEVRKQEIKEKREFLKENKPFIIEEIGLQKYNYKLYRMRNQMRYINKKLKQIKTGEMQDKTKTLNELEKQ